jgi:hypothetical protein
MCKLQIKEKIGLLNIQIATAQDQSREIKEGGKMEGNRNP